MSILLNFAMFPTDKGASVSEYVSKVIENIKDSGVSYKLNSMGTTIETETMADALKVVEDSYKILEPYSDRIYCTINIDARPNISNRMGGKIESIEEKIGNVNH